MFYNYKWNIIFENFKKTVVHLELTQYSEPPTPQLKKLFKALLYQIQDCFAYYILFFPYYVLNT